MPRLTTALFPGDIVLVRSETRFGWLIRQFTRTFGEKRSKVNHAAIMVNASDVIEVGQRTIKRNLQRHYAGTANAIAVYRWKGLTVNQRITIAEKAMSYLGAEYGWWKIVAHGIDRMIGGPYLFRRLARQDRYPICSWMVAWSYAAIGKDFGVSAKAADPDHIWDYCVEGETKGQFLEIFALGRL